MQGDFTELIGPIVFYFGISAEDGWTNRWSVQYGVEMQKHK